MRGDTCGQIDKQPKRQIQASRPAHERRPSYDELGGNGPYDCEHEDGQTVASGRARAAKY